VKRRILCAGLNCLTELLLRRKREPEIGHRHEHSEQYRRRQTEFDCGYAAVTAEKAAQADNKAVARACSGIASAVKPAFVEWQYTGKIAHRALPMPGNGHKLEVPLSDALQVVHAIAIVEFYRFGFLYHPALS
jgi:hypothetical protein